MPIVNTDRDLVRLLLASVAGGRIDLVAAQVLGDWLEEHDDPRAEDVRELAEVRFVVPMSRPPCHRPRDGRPWPAIPEPGMALERCRPNQPHARAETFPVACGRWWSIRLSPEELGVWLGDGPQVMAFSEAWGCVGYAPSLPLPPDDERPLAVLIGQEAPRFLAELLAGLFGYALPPFLECGGCGKCDECRYAGEMVWPDLVAASEHGPLA